MITDRYIPDPAEYAGEIKFTNWGMKNGDIHSRSYIADNIRSDESFNKYCERQTFRVRDNKNKES